MLATIMIWSFLIAFSIGSASSARAATASETGPQLEQRRDAPQTTVDEVADGVMCPTCDAPLSQSNSPAADRMRVWITAAVAAGWTKTEIRDGLVREYGGDRSILAVPDDGSARVLVWAVPLLVALVALIGGILTMRGWRRRSGGGDNVADPAGL